VLCASVAAFSAFQIVYVVAGVATSEAADRLNSVGLALAFVLWVVADARRRRCVPCYDFGFLVAVFFPVSLLWYLLWSRGWRGTFLLAALFGLLLLPWLAAVIAWVLMYGRA
jgi:hypothetical protein